MNSRHLRLLVLVWVCLGSIAAHGEQISPRDIWPQATAAADNNDLDNAVKKASELIETGKLYGIKVFPVYAESAAALARQAEKLNNKPVADWASKVAEQLDPTSASVTFNKGERAAAEKSWSEAAASAVRGMSKVWRGTRTSLISRADFLIVVALTLALTTLLFGIALFVRYGRSMAHDFREMLSERVRGGAVTVLAFALLFLPIFLWLGPGWLLFYWLVIFFGYATRAERTLSIMLALIMATLPILVDLSAHWIATVDSPLVMSDLASTEKSYHPDALHRMQELVALVPDNADIHLLLGNLHLQEGNEQQASVHYRRSLELSDSAGTHVNLGNLHFLDNDFAAAVTEYTRAEQLDPQLAIAFYNNSVASGEMYKFDEQGQKLEQAKRINRGAIERLSANPPTQKIVMYYPPLSEAWSISNSIARRATARGLFGNYSWFDPLVSSLNPLTLGSLVAVLFAVLLWVKRRRNGFAGSCIKCGRTFCHRCKSSRESATYCTQCIHIYLKRDGVSLDTKRSKLEEVHNHQNGMLRRNRVLATALPGLAQLLEGRSTTGIIGLFLFLFFVSLAILVGRLAPVIATSEVAKLLVRSTAIFLALITWLVMSLPVYKRKVVA